MSKSRMPRTETPTPAPASGSSTTTSEEPMLDNSLLLEMMNQESAGKDSTNTEKKATDWLNDPKGIVIGGRTLQNTGKGGKGGTRTA